MQKCLTITHPDQIQDADLYEYRFDQYFFQKEQIRFPCIFTIRKGGFLGNEEKRLEVFQKILKWKPTYVDLEHDCSFLDDIQGPKRIISYHNFEEMPDLEALELPAGDLQKIACWAHTIDDVLRMQQFAQKRGILGIAMGPLGELTRLRCQPWTYVSFSPQYGQLLPDERRDGRAPLYGLIGTSVHQSPSDRTHNRCGVCYVKMVVQPHELAGFLERSRTLFSGLSVTVGLKERVLDHLDWIDPKAQAIGAVNTIVNREGKLHGYNTDGTGAMEVLGNPCGKRITLLGLGGSARAIRFEALKRGAEVTVLNRTPKEGALPLHTQTEYDILINTVPLPMPIPLENILEGATVMDIQLQVTPFLRAAHQKGCSTILGFEMFIAQAIEQFCLWDNKLAF